MGDFRRLVILNKALQLFRSRGLWQFVVGLLFLVPVWFYFEPAREYIGYFFLVVAFLFIVKSLNIHSIAIGSSGVALSLLREAKEVQKGMKEMLYLLVPIIARTGFSEGPNNHLPHSGRIYIYDLIQQIQKDEELSDSEKNELTQELKWVLIKFIFNTMKHELEELIQESSAHASLVNIQHIETAIKNILNAKNYTFSWLIQEMRGFTIDDLTGENELLYKKIRSDYVKIIERFISTGTIDKYFLEQGKRELNQ